MFERSRRVFEPGGSILKGIRYVVGVTLTLLIYEVITHSYMNEKIGTRY